MTETCQMCGHPVDMPIPHITVTRQVEQQFGQGITVLDAEVMAYLHLACATPLHRIAVDPAGAVA